MSFFKSFEPNQLPGCQLWLDSQDIRSLVFSSSNVVQQWNDKSGNSRNFTQNVDATRRPTWVQADGLIFDGINDTLLSAANFPLGRSATPNTADGSFTRVFIFKTTSNSGFVFGQAGDYLWGNTGSSFEVSRNSTANGKNVANTWLNDNETKVVFWTYNGTGASHQVYINGALRTSTGGATNPGFQTAQAQISLMSRASASFLSGNLYEVCIFDRPLTTDEMKLLQLYFGFKYSLNILIRNTLLNNTSTWIKGPNLTANGAVSDPDGGSLAYSFTSTAVGNSYLYQNVALVANTKYRLSIRVKSSSSTPFFFTYFEWTGSTYNIRSSPPAATSNTWQTVTWEFTTNTPTIGFNQIHVVSADRPNGSEFSIYKPTLARLT